MKRLSSFSILLTFVLLFLTSIIAAASFASEAAEIPYQINNSDRIIVGTVSEINMSRDHTIATIKVNEWLYNPLPTESIKVRSERGTNLLTTVEVEFVHNESVLLMLNDVDLDKQLFRVGIGVPGKHPASDRDVVIEELKAQGKWQEENQTANKTNDTEMTEDTEGVGSQKENITENTMVDNEKKENTGTIDKQEDESNTTQESNSTPFISSFWLFVIVLGTIMYVRKTK
jgi:hypothetical protein